MIKQKWYNKGIRMNYIHTGCPKNKHRLAEKEPTYILCDIKVRETCLLHLKLVVLIAYIWFNLKTLNSDEK